MRSALTRFALRPATNRGLSFFSQRFCSSSLSSSSLQTQSVPPFITAADLSSMDVSSGSLDSRILVDVRSPEDFSAGHIDGAVNIREIFTYLQRSSDNEGMKETQEYFRELFSQSGISGNNSEHVIIYEHSMDNNLGVSCRGWFLFQFMGHPNVSVLSDGMEGYLRLTEAQRTQLASSNQDHPPVSSYLGSVDPEQSRHLMADRYDVLKVIENSSEMNSDDKNGRRTVLLDTRSEAEWRGLQTTPGSVNPDLRLGRLPGAVWCEWTELIQSGDGERPSLSKSKDEIQRMMKERGINLDDEIIVYCYKGSRAANSLMLLKQAGFERVRNYFGSWQEWSRDPNLPIDDEIYRD